MTSFPSSFPLFSTCRGISVQKPNVHLRPFPSLCSTHPGSNLNSPHELQRVLQTLWNISTRMTSSEPLHSREGNRWALLPVLPLLTRVQVHAGEEEEEAWEVVTYSRRFQEWEKNEVHPKAHLIPFITTHQLWNLIDPAVVNLPYLPWFPFQILQLTFLLSLTCIFSDTPRPTPYQYTQGFR